MENKKVYYVDEEKNSDIFISYSWEDDVLVNSIDDYFAKKNIILQRDKRGIKAWESIKEFMKKIRKSDCAILIVSKNYLKSINCMYEVLEVMKDENYRDRIFTVVLNDTNIYSPLGKAKYIKYWKDQHNNLEKEIKEIDDSEITIELSQDLKKIRYIMSSIGEFISIISDMNNPIVDDNICNEISKKLLEKGIISKDVLEGTKDIDSFDDHNAFFDYRLGKAFPGLRGGKWFTPQDGIIERLNLLLKEPLSSKNLSDPIWWFRGGSCLYIDYFKPISFEKCIIEAKECLIDKVYVYQSGSYYKSFIYVELKPEEPVGIYESSNEYLEMQTKHFGYAYEEYAIYNKQPITRAQYDDGAAFLNGNYVEFNNNAEVRIRYLTKYNFIICSKFNPINSILGEKVTEKILNSIIKGESSVEDLVDAIEKLPKSIE
ncbi:toll/interleukin-1 receptor domain-containing protein [Clostridium perfringens]|uniref:toll/interleukin-1 receptor domain-containing protein n=1 Tax=Clostridium perfringens TaxID=1502 RepID=UPI0039E9104E